MRLPLVLLLTASLLSACGEENDPPASSPDPIETPQENAEDIPQEDAPKTDADNNNSPLFEPSPLPEGFEDLDATYFRDVPYGPDPRNTLDLFVPNQQDPAKLVIYIHGGGFTSGSKDKIYGSNTSRGIVRSFVEAGVAYASLNYRLLQEGDQEGVLKCLQDSTRGLQFLRHHAAFFRLDAENVVLSGSSAGAGTSLWIATHDDMARPSSPDPIQRQSTRVNAAFVYETQATYNINKWESVVFAEYELSILDTIVELNLANTILAFYGISSRAEYNSPHLDEYRARVDILDLMDAEDPPIWVENDAHPNHPPNTAGLLYHHAHHARALHERAREVGQESHVYAPALGIEDEPRESALDFALRHLER